LILAGIFAKKANKVDFYLSVLVWKEVARMCREHDLNCHVFDLSLQPLPAEEHVSAST
jgi:hypothetical protein